MRRQPPKISPGCAELRRALSKPNDMGAQLAAVVHVAQVDVVLPPQDRVFVVLWPGFHKLAVQVHDAGRAGAFVEVVYILGYDCDGMACRLKLSQRKMGAVRFGFMALPSAGIIEAEHSLPALGPRP